MPNPREPERKRILFVGSREPQYSRVKIVRRALRKSFEVDELVSSSTSYSRRLLQVLPRFLLRRKRRYDAVFVGFFAQPILPLVRSIWHGPLVSDLYFSLYDTWIHDKKRFNDATFAARAAHRLDRYALCRSDLVFVDTAAHADYFASTFGPCSTPIKRLWISGDTSDFPLLEPASYNPGDRFEVLFFGGYIPLQGVDVIVEAAANLPGKHYHFTLVGDGQTLPACRRRAAELGVSNLAFADFEPVDRIVERARQSHLVLGIFGNTAKAQRVIPNKAFETLALGRPLVTGDSPAIRELLTDGEDVLLTPMADPRTLATKVRWARDHYAATAAIGRRGNETFHQRASPTVVAEILKREIDRLLETPGLSRANSSR